MPLPLIVIPLALAAAALSGGVFVAAKAIAKSLEGKNVAILGGQQVGKTTLLNLLRGGENQELQTLGGKFTIEIKGKPVDLNVPRDLAGRDGLGFAAWKEAFSESDYLWYLFRADLIARRDAETIELVKGHLDMFKAWLGTAAGARPKVILIGTWADQHPDFARRVARFIKTVDESDVIKFGSVKLNNAGVVVGSLATEKDADKLLKGIKSRLR